jgi:hypothetical protein
MTISALLQSHDELRAIPKITQRELKKPPVVDRNNLLMENIQEVLKKAKAVAEEERRAKRFKVRVKLKV